VVVEVVTVVVDVVEVTLVVVLEVVVVIVVVVVEELDVVVVVHCQWTEWTPWGACSASCDGGYQTRTRDFAQEAAHGGMSCSGASSEDQECNPHVCPTST
jgi:hypothetical protein